MSKFNFQSLIYLTSQQDLSQLTPLFFLQILFFAVFQDILAVS